MGSIIGIEAREVLDSRGNPTVQADVQSENGFGRATSPSGASTGSHEALELRDGGKRYSGKGVLQAVANVNGAIANALIGKEVSAQPSIDSLLCSLDGTPNKSRLGANATTAVSLAVAQCAASEKRCGLYRLFQRASTGAAAPLSVASQRSATSPSVSATSHSRIGGKPLLPAPMMNVLNGGKHADNGIAIQEFMIFPLHFDSFSSALQSGAEIYHELGQLIGKKYGKGSLGLGDEGGFAPPCKSTLAALDLLEKAIGNCGYSKKVKLAIDAAASSFYDPKSGKYSIDGRRRTSGQLSDLYVSLCKSYPIVSLEDPFGEESFGDFASLRKKLSGKVQIVGDDLLVTSVSRLKTAISHQSVSALLLKVNQVGTLTESLSAAALCKKSGLGVIVSHRSGESEDSAIADIAVGLGCGQIKTGSLARAERTAKYNRLLQIEEELPSGSFARDSGLVK